MATFCAAGAFAQVLEPNVPDVAPCHGLLNQDIVDAVHAATEDPAKTFEKWRRDNRNMMEASPVVDCASKLWQAFAHGKGLTNFAKVPDGTDALSLRSRDVAADNFLHELAASIGSNADPASGEPTYQGEVQIAVNPNNPLQMVAGANTFYRDPSSLCQSAKGGASKTYGTEALYGSSDGGATWTYRCAPWPAAINGGVSGADEYFGSDPAVAWDSQGRAVAVYMLISANSHNNKSGASIVCMRSSDVGNSWTHLGTVVDNIGSSTVFDDKEFVAVDNSPGPSSTLSHPGRIYVIWDENNVERVAHSDDGATWTTVVLSTPPANNFDIGGDVKVGPDGTVYVIWNRLIYSGSAQSSEQTVFSKSVNGGTTWSAPVTIATQGLLSFGTNNTPPAQDSRGINAFGSLTLDSNSSSPYFGRLYVTFSDFPTGTTSGTNTNVYVVTSSNGGTTWTTRVKVNDDAGAATQFFPWMAVDPTDGSVNVAWYDTRSDVTNNRKAQFYYSRSSNGATSFETNLLVNDNGGTTWVNGVNYSDENTTDNTNSNANQYGDYSGLVAYNRKVQPLWTDSRQFYPTSGDARVEDAATATIVNCSAPSTLNVTTTVGASCATPSVEISWNSIANWGTNATTGTYTLRRSTSPSGGGTALLTNSNATSFSDTTGVAGTTYYYSVTAKNNCPGTTLTPMSTTTIAAARLYPSVSTAPSATVSGDATICNGTSTPIQAALTGTAPWIVTWSDGVTQSNISVSPATRNVSPSTMTTYTVTAVSDANCFGSSSGSAAITVNPIPATPTISAGGPTTFCAGGSVTLTSSSMTGNQWYLNGNAIMGATMQSYFATASGNYSVTVTSLGCTSPASATTSVTVNPIPPQPTIFVSGSTTICAGSSVTLTSSEPSGNQWYLDGNAIMGATMQSYFASAAGNYTVQVTLLGCTGPMSAATSVTVNPIPAAPTIMPGGPTTFCAGGSVTLTSSEAAGNQWYLNGNAIMGETNQTYMATLSGDYTVTVTTLGCTSAQSSPTTVVVNPIPPTPAITPGGPTTFCAGGSVTLNSDAASGNQWYLNGNLIMGATGTSYLASAAGDYTVQVTLLGCTSAMSSATTVTVNPIPSAPTVMAGGPTTFCAGGSVTLTSSEAAGNQWYLNGNAIISATNQTYDATASGDYTVTVTTLGCTSAASAPTTVVVNAIPATPTIMAGGPTTFCAGGSVTLTSSSATGNQWYVDGNIIMGATNPTFDASASGSYTVIVTTNNCSSAASAPASVTVVPVPSAPTLMAGGSTTFCAGGSVTLTSSETSGNQWYLDGNIINGATNQTYGATASGSYTVTVTTNGCTSVQSSATTVTVNPLPPTPTINASGPTTFCNGNTVTLTSSSASGNQWYRDGNIINGATGTQYVVTASGAYTVKVTDGNSCVSVASAPTQVTVTPVTVNPATVPDGGFGTPYGPVTFTESGGSGTASFTIMGALPAGLTFNSGTISGTPTQSGSFPFTISATDTGGCTGSANYTLTIVAVPTNLVATAASTTSISLTWTGSAGASGYEISRNGDWVTNSMTTSFTDSTVTAGNAYIYRVRALTSSSPSLYSAADLASTFIFTDDPLVAATTKVKAVHLTELRSAVNAVRALAGLSAATFTDPTPSSVKIKSVHITELRNALNPARTTLGLAALTFANSANAGTTVRAVDFTELRNGVK